MPSPASWPWSRTLAPAGWRAEDGATALRPPPEPAEFGIGRARELEWNRLAMFDAGVQCGKCEAACPACAAGQPLNPKKLINDLVRDLRGGVGDEYSGHGHPSAPHARPLDELVPGLGPRPLAPETLWSCTTCRAGVDACPMLIEHLDAIVDLRRHETLTRGVPPTGWPPLCWSCASRIPFPGGHCRIASIGRPT